MDKPMTLLYEEIKQGVAELVYGSGFPAFVVKPIIKDLLDDIENIEKRQYEYDREQYEIYLKSQCVTSDIRDFENEDAVNAKPKEE